MTSKRTPPVERPGVFVWICALKFRNPKHGRRLGRKHEIRKNSRHKEASSKRSRRRSTGGFVSGFSSLDLDLVSDFVLRISDLKVAGLRPPGWDYPTGTNRFTCP